MRVFQAMRNGSISQPRGPITRTMSYCLLLTMAVLVVSCFLPCALAYCGVQAIIRRAQSLPASPCSQCLRCHSTTPQPSSWDHCVRGSLLVTAIAFAVSLSIAEVHYARMWPPEDIRSAMREAKAAARAYPLMARFRDAPALRLKLYAEKGI